jgi:hypothetical protein
MTASQFIIYLSEAIFNADGEEVLITLHHEGRVYDIDGPRFPLGEPSAGPALNVGTQRFSMTAR